MHCAYLCEPSFLQKFRNKFQLIWSFYLKVMFVCCFEKKKKSFVKKNIERPAGAPLSLPPGPQPIISFRVRVLQQPIWPRSSSRCRPGPACQFLSPADGWDPPAQHSHSHAPESRRNSRGRRTTPPPRARSTSASAPIYGRPRRPHRLPRKP